MAIKERQQAKEKKNGAKVNGTPAKKNPTIKKAKVVEANILDDDSIAVTEPEDPENEFAGAMGKTDAEAVKQRYLARAAKLRYLTDAGALMPTEKIIEELRQIAIEVKKSFLRIPDRVSELFASLDDSRKISCILNREIN